MDFVYTKLNHEQIQNYIMVIQFKNLHLKDKGSAKIHGIYINDK